MRDGPPVVFHWRWYYHLVSIAFWALILLPALLVKENRRWQAWAILIPLLVIVVICQMLANLGTSQGGAVDEFWSFVVTLAAAWAAVWLVGFWFAGLRPRLAFAAAVAVMLAVGLLSYLCDGRALKLESLAPLSIYYLFFALALMLPMSLSSRCCRKVYAPRRFMLWLLLWTPLMLAGIMLLFVGGMTVFMSVATRSLGMTHILIIVPVTVVMGGVYGVGLYLLNLPFMLLVFRNSFYRERFCKVFGLQLALDPATEEAEMSEKPSDGGAGDQ